MLPVQPVAPEAPGSATECADCRKPTALCVCDGIVPIENKVAVLILQHPQEQDRVLGTARLAALHFRDAVMKIGLSWPSLGKILGRTADPHRWAVLYLGSVKAAQLAPDREIVFVNRKGELERDQDVLMRDIEGIVLLDGTWSQAKALVVAQCVDAQMPAGRARSAAAVALRQAAARAPPRRIVDHRGGGDAVEPAGAPARHRGNAGRELRADVGSRPRTGHGVGRAAALSGTFVFAGPLFLLCHAQRSRRIPRAAGGTHAARKSRSPGYGETGD